MAEIVRDPDGSVFLTYSATSTRQFWDKIIPGTFVWIGLKGSQDRLYAVRSVQPNGIQIYPLDEQQSGSALIFKNGKLVVYGAEDAGYTIRFDHTHTASSDFASGWVTPRDNDFYPANDRAYHRFLQTGFGQIVNRADLDRMIGEDGDLSGLCITREQMILDMHRRLNGEQADPSFHPDSEEHHQGGEPDTDEDLTLTAYAGSAANLILGELNK